LIREAPSSAKACLELAASHGREEGLRDLEKPTWLDVARCSELGRTVERLKGVRAAHRGPARHHLEGGRSGGLELGDLLRHLHLERLRKDGGGLVLIPVAEGRQRTRLARPAAA